MAGARYEGELNDDRPQNPRASTAIVSAPIERKANNFYPTPSELAISLALGLELGLDLPRVALDPCGGDGALRWPGALWGRCAVERSLPG